jgi:cyclopropane fatty-acyl-phospholipid synthase-like methyltransferase
MIERPDSDSPSARAGWDRAYIEERAPWDIGRPQPVFVSLAEAGEIRSPVLDSGCGTGEQALMLAQRGMEVVGVDISPAAVSRAKAKAARRSLAVEFMVGDVLELGRLGRRFATVVDAGTFHTFNDHDRARYVSSLAAALEPGGVLHLLCFSDRVPGHLGPRRVSQAELREAFSEGWRVERIDDAEFEVSAEFPARRPHAWLARIVRSN